jgi:hypothetical protein
MIMIVLQQVQSHLGMMIAWFPRLVVWLDLMFGRLVVRLVVWLDLMLAHLYLLIGILLRLQSCLDSATKIVMMSTRGCKRLSNCFHTLNNHMMATNSSY